MGSWGSNQDGVKSRADCKKWVDSFTNNERSPEKDIKYHDKKFTDLEEARKYLNECDVDNDGPAEAVSYYAAPEVVKITKASKRVVSIEKEDVPQLNTKIITAVAALIGSSKSGEIEFVKCPDCSSKINSHFIAAPDPYWIIHEPQKEILFTCPACSGKGLSPKCYKQGVKDLAKIRKGLVDLREEWKILKEKIKNENESELVWLIEVSIRS